MVIRARTVTLSFLALVLSVSAGAAQLKPEVGGGVDGDPNGAIRALGDADHDLDRPKPAVTIPKISSGPSRTGGVLRRPRP